MSLRGTAYMLALTQASQVLEMDDLKGAWRGELDRMARGGVAAVEAQAIACYEGLIPGDKRQTAPATRATPLCFRKLLFGRAHL